ncbi:hypothetical protein LC593_33945 [Nostoc sp. CHAB 5844]|nr:hypothetical protein [Nostoc sp. CHAB 5844]
MAQIRTQDSTCSIDQAITSNVNTLEFDEYRLHCVGGEPLTWRCFQGIRFIGLVFEHLTHWSNAVDNIRHQEPLTAVIALDEFMQAAGVIRKAQETHLGAVA